MGIKICPQCNGKVSDTRNDCPHCNYIFPKLKKCPDCEEEIDDSLLECPICGHFFVEGTKDEIVQEPIVQQELEAQQEAIVQQAEKVEQKVEKSEELTCPYCNSTESMQLGNDLYLCNTCKSKFMDTRGLPTSPVYSKKPANNPAPVPVKEEKPANNPAPVPVKEEKPDNATVVASKTKKNPAAVWLWISLGFTIFSYLVNMIISLSIEGALYYMFENIT